MEWLTSNPKPTSSIAKKQETNTSSTMFLSFFFVTLLSPCFSAPLPFLSKGSYLSSEDRSTVLISPSKSFSAGFYEVGNNAYTFSIWFTHSTNKTVSWTANRDRPINGHRSRLTFRSNGDMALTVLDGTVVWSTNTGSSNAVRARLLDTGNLVVEDINGKIVWQSFDFPTDTLLPSQPLTKDTKLISALSAYTPYSGYFEFYFDDSNVLRLTYNGPEVSSVYWPNPDQDVWANGRNIYNSSRCAVLDDLGEFFASDQFHFTAVDAGSPSMKRRLTLDYDGNLRLYSLEEAGLWSVSWQAILDNCKIHGLCGKNGICVSYPRLQCSCPPGYEMSDPSNWSMGCKPWFNLSCDTKREDMEFMSLPYTDFWGFDFNAAKLISFDECKQRCLSDCRCQGFSYQLGTGLCYGKTVLYNGRTTPSINIYIKVPKSSPNAKSSKPDIHGLTCNSTKVVSVVGSSEMLGKSSESIIWVYIYSCLAAIFVVEALFIAIGWCLIYRKGDDEVLLAQGYKVISSQFRRFSYTEIKRATRNFKEELGRGGTGIVYKGSMENGLLVAVKKLEEVMQGEEEFWGEVSIIGRIYHMNLVRTWGFCSEGSHKLLVCEYVHNGSLDRALFDENNTLLGWKERFKIAVGVARGLAYLHHECLEWVIHCDVKPENILLGSNYEPKIADFGLSKLLNRGGIGSNLSRIRGTRGYIAPEWASNLPITGKIDVYSYGIVLLELISGTRISALAMQELKQSETMATKRLCVVVKENLGREGEAWVEKFADSRLKGEFDSKQAMRMVKVAVCCLEEERNRRPTMEAIVQMLLSHEEDLSSHITKSQEF